MQDPIRIAQRALVDESRIPVDAGAIFALAEAADREQPWAAIQAMARATRDPHTVLLSAAMGAQVGAYSQGQAHRAPGFTVHTSGADRVVGEVTPSGAAAAAGLLPGDVLRAIDDDPATHGFEDLASLMERPEGSRAALQVQRGDSQLSLGLSLVAGLPELVAARKLTADIGYLRLRAVTSSSDPERDTAALTRKALESLGGSALRGLVLDLRSNAGGYGVVRVTSVLTDRSPLARYRDAAGAEDVDARTDVAPACACPIVVLVDEHTLSAAEMITLALQDHGVARVVGQPTAGGLTVPRFVPLDETHLLMTPERFALAPHSAQQPQGLRVQPDELVPNRSPADFAAGRDAQLERALELLQR